VAPGIFVDSTGTAVSLFTIVNAALDWETVDRAECDCYRARKTPARERSITAA
jgi:hypothetical protein